MNHRSPVKDRLVETCRCARWSVRRHRCARRCGPRRGPACGSRRRRASSCRSILASVSAPTARIGGIPQRDRGFESISLQRGVCKPSVPRGSPGVLSAVWAAVWVVVLPDRKQYRRTGDRGDRRGGSRLYRDIRSGDQAEARGAEHALLLALLLSAASSWPPGPEFPQGYRGLSRPSNEVHKAGKGATRRDQEA